MSTIHKKQPNLDIVGKLNTSTLLTDHNTIKDMNNLKAYNELLKALHGLSYTRFTFLQACNLEYSSRCFHSLLKTGLLIKKSNGTYLVSYNEEKMKEFSKRYLEITRRNRDASREWTKIHRSPNLKRRRGMVSRGHYIPVPPGSYLRQLIFMMKWLWRARKTNKTIKNK